MCCSSEQPLVGSEFGTDPDNGYEGDNAFQTCQQLETSSANTSQYLPDVNKLVTTLMQLCNNPHAP